MRYAILQVVLLLAALTAAVHPAGEILGAENTPAAQPSAAAPPAGAPLEFRRVYAPADQWKDWPRDGIRYVPIKPEEFERLITSVQTAGQQLPLASASITSAQYRATLDSKATLHGEATLSIVCGPDHQAMLPLDPCGLAITQATWLGAEPQAAELGLGVDGKPAVLVKRSGDLRLLWSLRGRREPGDALQFLLDLPSCPTSRLLLDLPSNLEPIAAGGATIREASKDAGRGQWRIELGGHHRAGLRIVTGGQSEPRRPLTLARHVLAYDLSLHGLDLSMELRLDVHNEPLREVAIAMDPRLELVKAQFGDVAVPWSIVSPAGEGRGARVLLQLPEPIQGTGRVLRLGAVAPLQLERRWRLPAIRAEGTFWQEGIATIGVRAPLNLEQLVAVRGRQSKTGTLSGPRPGQSAEIQYFAEDAGVEVVLAQARGRLQWDSGTTVELSGGEITGRVVAELSIADGELFQLEAEIGRQWLIDSVEAEPAGILREGWNVKKEDDGSEKLVVQLEKALSPSRPVRLTVAGRRLHALSGQPLDAEDLTLLRFPEASRGKRLLAVHAAEPYRLKLERAERVQRIEPEKLTEADRRLLQKPRDLVFAGDAGATLEISLVTPKPSYSAAIRVEATAFASKAAGIKSHWLRESYRVRCVPDATRVGRVLVHFCSPRSTPPKWSLGAAGEGQFEARLLSAAEQASALMDTRGETWELVFRQPKGSPFEIHASRLIEWNEGKIPVSLICVPEAAQQHGSLVVRSGDATAIRIQNDRLDPLPLEDLPPEQICTARASFRYNPKNDADRADQPAVTLELEKSLLPAAWIWNCQLQSRYQVEGTGRHSVTYCLESDGKPQLDLLLPSSASLEKIAGIWIDGQPASWQSVGQRSGRHLVIELPEGRRFPVVHLQFQTDGSTLRTGQVLDPELPSVDVPILRQQWTVWLPPGYGAGIQSPWRLAQREVASSWSERVFGPLGRPASAAPFDPLAVESWARLRASGLNAPTLHQAAWQFTERLSELEQRSRQAIVPTGGEGRGAIALNWGSLLSAAIDGTDELLLIDAPALARMRLGARTPVVTVGSETSALRGVALLDRAGLALLAFPEGLLLTSAGDANSYHPYLVPLDGGTLWQVERGPLAERLQKAAAAGEDPSFVLVDRWQLQPARPTSPWLASSAGDQSLDTLGWTAFRTILSPGNPVHLSVTCQDTERSIQWIVFLTVFALLWWIARQRPAVSIAVLVFAAAAALVVAEPYAAAASGAVVGALMALVLYLVRFRPAKDGRWQAQAHEPEPGTSHRSSVHIGAALVTAGILAGALSSARAEAPSAKSAPPERNIHKVLIPVDAQQHPTGGNYFVPEVLYQQLQRRASERTEQPQGWLLRGATYRGTLARQSTPEQLVVNQFKAIFDLEVFNPAARIRIPLRREGVNLVPDGATLDGRVIEPEWQEGDSALVFDVDQTGPYRLELSLRPTVRMFGTSYGVDLQIPRLPTSRLELNLPADAPSIEVPSAAGSLTLEQMPARLVAELGASDRLAVRWPDLAGSARTGPAIDVEQLFWLKVHPGSVVLSTRLKVKVVEGVVRQLRLAVDPRLRLLPFREPDPPVAQVQTTAGETQTIQFDMARPISDQVVVEANFLLAGTSGIGNVRLPQVQVLDAHVTKRWLAISVDRALEYPKQQPADGLEPVAVPVFEAAWGKAEGAPTLAYNLPSTPPAWSLATRPDEPQIAVDQVTIVSFAPAMARVQFEAQVVTTGYGFQYHLSAPKQLRVESVLVEDTLQRSARWSRDSEGGITVFLNEPATGKQRLTVQGRMNTPMHGSAALPVLRVDSAEIHSSQIQVFREPSVLVGLTEVQGLTEGELPVVGDERLPLGRLVKHFIVADHSKAINATVNLSPNQPELVADQVTYLHAEDTAWEAEVDFHVKVSRGVVDEFRIPLPNLWGGPFRIDPAAAFRIDEGAGKARRELVIRPSAAVDREYRFRVSGPLAVQPGERPSVPAIRLLEADRGESLVVLPRQLETHPVNWQTRGLKRMDPPPVLVAPPVALESSVAYKIESNSFDAVLNPVDRANQAPTVLLADIHLAWQADGSYQGLALFDLEPAGLSQCPLRLPSHARVVSVRVDGVPVLPQPKAENLWQFPLSSAPVPKRVEVLFTGQVSSPASTGIFPVETPGLGDLAIWQTLWSISAPLEFQMRLPGGVELVDLGQVDLVRMEAIASVTDLISSLNLSARPEELEKTERWQGIWCRRWEACRQQFGQHVGGDSLRLRGALATEIDALDRRYKELRSQLDRGGASNPSTAEPSLLEPPQLWPSWIAGPQRTVHCVAEPGPSVLLVRVQDTQFNPWWYRWLGALACAMLVPLTAVGKVRRWTFRLCCQWPAAVGVAAGLAWWLCLEPSILGWLLVLLTLTVSLVPVWRRLRPTTPVVVVNVTQR